MATKSTGQNKNVGFKLPEFLTLKDLITIISIAVTLTLGWGMFTTRITLIEKDVVQLHTENDKQAAAIDKLQDKIQQLETTQRLNSILIDQLYISLRKPVPSRTNN